MKCLSEWCPQLATTKDLNGDLAIHLAAARRHFNCVKHLCRPEVIDVMGGNGCTALHYATEHGDAAAVKYLIEHNADVDTRQSHELQDPPLIKAIQRNYQAIIDILIDRVADTESMDKRGWRPLHFAAYHGYTELASRLLDLGCERQPQTHLGETPFYLAIARNRPDIIEIFMKHDMGISDVETCQGLSHAHIAAFHGRLDILRELIKTDRSILFRTTLAGVDTLYIAAVVGDHTTVDFLIRSGMKPGGMGRFVDVPLAGAASYSCIKTVDVLLSLGADVNQTDSWERTPLSRAVEGGYLKIAHHLLKAGANPHIRDAIGFSAFDYCVCNPAMMDVLRPWQSVSRTDFMAQDSNDQLVRLAQCISRSARAIADLRRNATYGTFRMDDTERHLMNILSFLFRLALGPFTPPRLPAQKTLTAVPAKRAEILREWRVIATDSDILIYCCFCQRTLRREFYACSICGAYVCEACLSQLRFETQPQMRVKAWKEVQQLEKDVIPISKVLMDLAYENSRVVGEVLSQDNILGHWVLAKRREYAKWRKRWDLHHIRTVDFHGYHLVHTMARVLSPGQDREMSDNESASDALDIAQCKSTKKTPSDLTERWQDIFFYRVIDGDLDSSPCEHISFLKGSKQRQSLREPQIVFDSDGRLTSETFDLLAQKYEDCLASGDLTFEQLQTRCFTDSIVQGCDNPNNGPERCIGEECSSGADADSHDETASLEGASDTTSDVTDASVVSDMEDEAQIDVEEILEKLLVKRGSLMKENSLTDEKDLVLETAWRFVQAIVYHDTPRQSLKDISEQGGEWHTAPGTPMVFGLGGLSSVSSHYSTAGSI